MVHFNHLALTALVFVASIYRAGFTSFLKKIRISNRYLYFHSPTSNIIYTHNNCNVFIVEQGVFRVEKSMMKIFLNKSNFLTTKKEENNNVVKNLPESVMCLTGTGGNTYFQLEKNGEESSLPCSKI